MTIYRRHRTFWGWVRDNRLGALAWRVAGEMGLPTYARSWTDDQREEVFNQMLQRTVPVRRCTTTKRDEMTRDDTNRTQRNQQMPKISEMMPSKWLAAADLEDESHNVTISKVRDEEVGNNKEKKWVLYFKEFDKGLVLNKTNMTTIGGLLGDDTDEWIGRQITLFPTQVDFQGKQVDAIRVKNRLPKPKGGKGEPKPEPVAANGSDDDDDNPPF